MKFESVVLEQESQGQPAAVEEEEEEERVGAAARLLGSFWIAALIRYT